MSSDSDSDWHDIVDTEEHAEEEVAQKSPCLFCDVMFSVANEAIEHMIETHKFDLKDMVLNENMDFYKYIKCINYIRREKPTVEALRRISSNVYSDEKWLMPVLNDDLMLQIDVDNIKETSLCGNGVSNELAAEERAKLAEEFLERTLDDLNKCRKELNNLLLGKSNEKNELVKKTKEEDDEHDGYFGSYSHFGIHEEMLKDQIRTESYQKFILMNPKLFVNSSVLDVGCGTSVLSMFSARAGAKLVYAVDYSEVAYQAMDIVKENNFDKVIKVVKGKAEDLCLTEKIDVIVSEWMGYFLLFESMLDTVIFCRDNYLSSSGCVYPDKCNIQIATLADDDLYSRKINFWNNVYGFKMTCMKNNVIEEPLVTVVDSKYVTSEPCVLKSFDLMNVNTAELDFDERFELKITQDGLVSAIVGYFDIFFERNASFPVTFSTSPTSAPTHWKQTVFFLKDPIETTVGDVLFGRIFCKKNKKDHRALDIALIFFNDKEELKLRQHYILA